MRRTRPDAATTAPTTPADTRRTQPACPPLPQRAKARSPSAPTHGAAAAGRAFLQARDPPHLRLGRRQGAISCRKPYRRPRCESVSRRNETIHFAFRNKPERFSLRRLYAKVENDAHSNRSQNALTRAVERSGRQTPRAKVDTSAFNGRLTSKAKFGTPLTWGNACVNTGATRMERIKTQTYRLSLLGAGSDSEK